MEVKLLKEKIDQAFSEEKPIIANGDMIGCCEEHEDDFLWYKDNDVDDFRKLISKNYFDWPQFGSLRPDLFCYFTKGFLIEVLNVLYDNKQSLDYADWIEDFLILYTPEKKDISRFLLDKVAAFSKDQIIVMREVIKFIDMCHFEQRNYHDKNTQLAIEKIWVT